MKRDIFLFIEDILESINAIESFSDGLNKEKLISSRLKQSAIIRELEIIGEAVKNIPSSFREKHPDISWNEIAGMRDVIIHGYFKVDLDAVWNVIKKDLPILKRKIEKIKKELMKEREEGY
ncbi:DUF86 domain-containing protein [Candidatus Pacearchaeota archaeon]|nr:DUF86 domain-containing protein [Candidatus Pacearchaeota archaeon]